MKLLIDCSYVDFTRQPTGIPRVVTQFVEYGYRWANRTGHRVIPVVTTPKGPIIVRPLPGARPPKYLSDIVVKSGGDPAVIAPRLEMASFHLQSALVEAGHEANLDRCSKAIKHTFSNLAEERSLPSIEIEKGDILFCPAYWHDVDPAYYWALQRQGCKIVTLVHDVLPITFARFYQAPWKHQFEANLLAHIKNADAMFAVSKYSADSIVEIATRKGIADVVVGVAHNGYHSLVPAEMKDEIRKGTYEPVLKKGYKYELLQKSNPFIMVGTLEPKKGHIPAIRAFEALWEAGLERPLVVAGRKGWLEQSVVHAIEHSPYYSKQLFWFEDMDDLDLYLAYHHSRGLIFASYAEGFGIPMIEALNAGRPVVAYDTPINREVLGKHGMMYDNFAQFARHVRTLDDDEGFEQACQKAAEFSWESWEEKVSGFFDRLVLRFGAGEMDPADLN